MNILDQIDQPTLLLDEAGTRKNISRLSARAREKAVSFRPHFKTHQSAQIGEWFRDQKVDRITVSSVEMAEYFALHGWQNISIAFSLNIRQIARIEALARQVHLEVLIENEEALAALSIPSSSELGIWIKIDAGSARTGVSWQNAAAVLALCESVKRNKRLTLLGLLTHSGNTYQASDRIEVCRIFREGVDRLGEVRSFLEAAGWAGLKVSVGDTPGCSLCPDWSEIDEVRPGNFVFYDASQAHAGSCAFEEISLALACPVVAKHPRRREVVVYGGAVHLSKDFLLVGGEKSYGLPALRSGNRWGAPIPGGRVRALSQEHGMVRIPGTEFDQISIGDLLFILPAHSCLSVQVMGEYLALSGEKISTFNRTRLAGD
ncbi:MAG: alanine racemase [Chloroflexi bacterium]|nr:alanine racemase [Chloroflexota bacterium]